MLSVLVLSPDKGILPGSFIFLLMGFGGTELTLTRLGDVGCSGAGGGGGGGEVIFSLDRLPSHESESLVGSRLTMSASLPL